MLHGNLPNGYSGAMPSANDASSAKMPLDDVPHDASSQMALWLLAAALHLADWVENALPELYERHRHLTGYRSAAAAAAPGLAANHWPARLTARERITSSDKSAAHPFARAATALHLTDAQRLAFAMAALAEEDARIGALFTDVQGGGDPYPSVETLNRVLGGSESPLGAGWDRVAPLVAAGLLTQTRAEGPRARRTLAPLPAAWDLARGATGAALPKGLRLRSRADAPRLEALAYAAAFRDRIARLPATLRPEGSRLVVLRHMPGTDIEDIAAALARHMERDLLISDSEAASERRTIGAAALLTDAIPFLAFEPTPGETVKLPDLGAWRGPVILSLGREGGLAPEAAAEAVTLSVPFPGPTERERAWRGVLGNRPVKAMDKIRDRFQLPLGHVRRAACAAIAEATLAGRSIVTPEDIRVAARALGREQLDDLADLLPDGTGWDDLVAPTETHALLVELAGRCTHRERLLHHFGTAQDGGAGRGVRALFTGPSGTGKTLAARLLSSEIGTDVYRVDLSAVVNKYVGETEKRLNQLLSRAEALDVILLLDEGDGLMARRTDVRSANDRFANLETNFLLQRLESHEGIVVVTTNMPEAIDPAFQRRMDVVVPFPRPGAEARMLLWQRHLPSDHAVADTALAQIASRAALTGGQIRNAVRAASSLALSAGTPISTDQLLQGLQRELQKAGAMAGVLHTGLERRSGDDGLAAFAAGLKAGLL